jgi:hypothetical protein
MPLGRAQVHMSRDWTRALGPQRRWLAPALTHGAVQVAPYPSWRAWPFRTGSASRSFGNRQWDLESGGWKTAWSPSGGCDQREARA